MFSYYGSKSKIVQYYPKPKYNKIIEPFAGSARYSLRYFENDVLLVDKYQVIVDVWHYLQSCSKNDILKLPKLTRGQSVNNFELSKIEKIFLGFLVTRGVESPRCNVSAFVNSIESTLLNIANNLFKIKHWTIYLGSYEQIENKQATWFIDPPYQFGGEHYKENKINHTDLAKWCKSRNGQSIVCENTKANWMDFKPMMKMQGTIHKTTEAIWSNLKTSYDIEQLNLFT